MDNAALVPNSSVLKTESTSRKQEAKIHCLAFPCFTGTVVATLTCMRKPANLTQQYLSSAEKGTQ